MTDLVVGVKLKADGSGLVGQAKVMVDALKAVRAAAGEVGVAGKGMATGTAAAEAGVRAVGAAATTATSAIRDTASETRVVSITARAAATAVQGLADDMRQAGAAAETLSRSSKIGMNMSTELVAVGAGSRAVAIGARDAGAAVQEMASDMRQAGAAAEALAHDNQTVAISSATVGAAAGAMARDQQQAARATNTFSKAVNDNEQAARRHQFAVRNAGQQVGDFGLQITSGASPVQAFSQQIGQLGYAMSEMRGKAGAVGTFLTGPWGIALTIGAAVIAPFIASLFTAKDAASQVELGANALGEAQSVMGQIFDLTTGKLKHNTEALILNAQAQALNLRATAAAKRESSDSAFIRSGLPSVSSTLLGGARILGGDFVGGVNQASGNAAVRRLGDRALSLQSIDTSTAAGQKKRADGFRQLLRETQGTDFSNSQIDKAAFSQAIVDQAAARSNEAIADLIEKSLDNKSLEVGLRRDATTKKPKKPKSTEARDEFGRDAEAKIAGIVGAFDGTPSALVKTNTQIRQLDDLIDDLNRKKPPNFAAIAASAEAAKVTVRDGLIRSLGEAFEKPKTLGDQAAAAFKQLDAIVADLEKRQPPGFEKLIASAAVARGAIEAGLNRPLADFIEAQQQTFQIGQAILAGRTAEADALRTIFALEKQRGAILLPAERAAVLGTVQALQTQERQIDRMRQKQQVYISGLQDIRGIVTQTIYEGPNSLASLPGRLLDSFKRFSAELITENLFGDTFEKLRDQVTGTKMVETAAKDTASAFGGVTGQAQQLSTVFGDLASAGRAAATAIGAGPTPVAGSMADAQTLSLALPNLIGQIAAQAASLRIPNLEGDPDIVVTGKRRPDLFGQGLGKIITDLGKKIGIDDEKAEKIGNNIGKKASAGLKGAVEGQAAASVAGLFGIKTSGTGSAIGGAIGGLTGLPGGSIIGGLLGGIVGNLFAKKAAPGGVTVGNVDGTAGQSGTSGSDSAAIKASGSLGEAVSNGINQVVDRLGGTLGSFSVSIGKYKDDLRVNENGRALGGVKGSQAVGFGDDSEAAVNYAISRAIAQGAVQGLSSAVAKALQSSTDVEKALSDALKVADLEKLLGGVTGQLTQIFKDQEALASDRVTLAKKYGLDLLQVEKINAEQRATLIADTLKSRIGSLTDVLSNLEYGDLFEGTASARRSKLLEQIAATKTDQENGVTGAGDRLAEQVRQLLSTSKEAFGTAGPEYTSDRNLARESVERAIAVETKRVDDAAAQSKATTDAVIAGNGLLNELNDQTATGNQQIVDALDAIRAAMTSGPSATFGLTTRTPIV